MSGDARRRKFRAQLDDEAQVQHGRYVDLALVWEKPDGSTLYVAGGQWDQEDECYTGAEPTMGKIVRLEPGQVEAAQWVLWWLQERRAGRPVDFVTLQLMGERSAGKTWTAANAMLLCILESPKLGIKNAIGWMASKTYEQRDELDRELKAAAPLQWYRYREEDKSYTFVTGAKVTNVSANDPESLKNGRVDWLVLNEVQKMSHKAYLNGIKRLSDKGGLSFLTGNWPTTRSGQWVLELEEKREEAERAGKTFPVRKVLMRKAGNRTLDAHTESQIDVIFRALDPRLAEADLDGLARPITELAYWEWSRSRNLVSRPDAAPNSIVRDITCEVTARKTMRRAGYEYVIGCDFQKYGGMWAIIHKIFGLPEAPALWAVDEIQIEGTEEDLIAELVENGYVPENSLIVGDGSGRWQDGEHVAGRNSFKVFKQARFNPVGPVPQKDENHRPKNPKFDDRSRLHNWMLKNGLYNVDPLGCKTLGEAMAKCEIRPGQYGQARPCVPWSHPTDAAGYVAMWLYGEKLRKPSGGGQRMYESLPTQLHDKYQLSR